MTIPKEASVARLSDEEKATKRRARQALWREKNREKLRLYFKEYRADHPDLKDYYRSYYRQHTAKWAARAKSVDARAKRREHRRKHAGRYNDARREWARKNPERAKAIEVRRRERGREKKRIADRIYRLQKPEIYKASIARAKAANPDLYKEISVQSSLRRRARKRALPVERVSRKRIHARDRERCHLCLKPIVGRATFDHLVPVVRGGAHAEWNLMLAHDRCNKSRGTKQILREETKEAALAYIASRSTEVAA